ncbi:SDR family NAD(P)-dependent oxidoreductase [Nonomuraea sp. NEAU-A123]|uniref:SDR family NAD(P)-dependent oxidoreductase n=1 Tax=Nonomuraea sp. NEAU-A123 TaxID=2839649 RepID=UPI001BE3F653|nr:SDR family oxidoreductase [Nonomuraea sp. NEAU-A123]MBT2225738.1 SDR family oxidoreductase [Nonomuraea sp. NEAU-A123]
MSTWLGLGGRRAVVAGAGGIGGAVAVALADAGAEVVVLDIDEAGLAKIERPSAEGSGGISGLAADLTSPAACRAALGEAAGRLGGLEVFVHAVGANDRRPVLDVTDETWEKIVTINLSSGFWLGQAAGALMVPRGYGRIVFLSSVSGLLAHKDHSPYAATKGGINQLMRVMAREWAASGVTVNAVAPGYVETDLTRAYLAKPGVRESMESLVPAGHLGTPEDLTGPVLFLASQRASFVTGHVLYVDGGRTLV